MLKINRSILIICMISLFLIIGQISACDTDSMTINDSNAIENDNSIEIDQNIDDSIEIEDENDKSIENIENIEKTDHSSETIEEERDTNGVVIANDNYSCGPASLATVLNRNGLNLSLNEMSEHTNTNLNGTSMQSIIDAARYYKFSAYGVEIDTQNLKENYIVHLNLNGCEHWTVISKVTDSHVFLADSSEGNMNFTIDEFNSYFTKKAHPELGAPF